MCTTLEGRQREQDQYATHLVTLIERTPGDKEGQRSTGWLLGPVCNVHEDFRFGNAGLVRHRTCRLGDTGEGREAYNRERG
ncbi:MAG: hypothetical protein ACT4R6_08475 [Gemmatimonadaceae bacterium]